jgi:hypothetical protein
VGIRDRDSCREHSRKLKILPLQSQYVLSFSLFVTNNKHYFMVNSEIQGGSNMTGTNCDMFTHKSSWSYLNHLVHNINTRTKCNLHQPLSHLSTYQKGTYYFGIKVSIVCLLKSKICRAIQNNLNRLQKVSYTSINFIQ